MDIESTHLRTFICRLLLLWAASWSLLAGAAPVLADHIEVELVAERPTVQPGEAFWIGLRLRPEAHWKTYWRNPGAVGLPTRLRWSLPNGVQSGEIQWPSPERFDTQGVVSYGYNGEVLLLTRMVADAALVPGATLNIAATASWLVCNEVCIPGQADLSVTLPVAAAAAPPSPLNPRWAALFAANRARLPQPLAAATSVFEVTGRQIRLQVDTGEVAHSATSRAAFYPQVKRLIDPAAPFESTADGGRFRLTLPLHVRQHAAPERIDGVLVVTDGEHSRAYQITAMPVPLAATAAASGIAGVGIQPPQSLPLVLLLAMFGGLALNLMPCVFPVLMLKAIHLLESVEVGARSQRLHGLAYTAGVVLFFCLVASVLQLLRASGSTVGWGFQLQTPWFVAALTYLLFMLGLSFSGVLEIGGRLTGLGQSLAGRSGYAGSFFTGALAAVVASPCTAPFMGAAIAYAITQAFSTSLLIFIALGLGMALPFLVVSFVPQVARMLPRPGAWMNVFKQAMAFPLYLTALWLLWVLGRQTDVTHAVLVLAGMLLMVFAAWLYGLRLKAGSAWMQINVSIAILSVVAALSILFQPGLRQSKPGPATAQAEAPFWEPYSADRLAALRSAGRPVFLNITADWCISCIANERVALSIPSVREAFHNAGIVPLKGDWTNGDPELTAILESFGRNGVPLYVLYPADPKRPPQVLSQWLTPMNVMASIRAVVPGAD